MQGFGRKATVLLILAATAGIAVVWLYPAGDASTRDAAATGATAPDGEPHRLPVFMIDVGGNEIIRSAKIQGTLKVVSDHDGALDDLAGRATDLESPIGIEIRGATSVILPKKSYDIELQTARGDDRKLPLLGLPPDSDWALHGCGQDDTCLRNALAYDIARELGRYAPRTRFVELLLDGEYRGLYLLIERVRRGEHRVDLPRPAQDGRQGDVTGGYIFKMDLAEGHPRDPIPRDWISPVSPAVYSYHYPRYDDISPAQKKYLHEHMADFERLMMSSHWNDERRGYPAWIDVPSWVDFALIQELSNNIDAYQKSHYFQKWPESLGNKIALGPIWDFDNAFGSTDVREGSRTDVWAHQMNRFGGEDVPYAPPGRVPHVPAYWERLWADPAFHAQLQCRWRTLRGGPLQLENLVARIDAWTRELDHAQRRNDAAWEIDESYSRRVGRLTAWLSARVAWMDENLPGACA